MQFPFIDLKKQYELNKTNLDNAMLNVLQHGQYIQGPEVKLLEEKLADYVGTKHAIACSSGTDALVMTLMTLGLSKSDAVFTTPFSFFATAEAITLAGGTPVFVDIDPHTFNLCPKSLKKTVESVNKQGKLNPRAVIPVDLFGQAACYEDIEAISKQYDLFTLEDAAQSFGAPSGSSKACSFGDAATTSFYPAKPLGCYGDGGAVFTNSDELYDELISLRVHGQATSGDKYDNVRIGLNARMDTIQAAVLIEKLRSYPQEISMRNQVAQTYSESLCDGVVTPFVKPENESVWAQYSILVDDRDGLKNHLAERGIPTAVFYPIPIHLSKAYKFLGYEQGDFPICEEIANKIISLPMHPYLEKSAIETISTAVNDYVNA